MESARKFIMDDDNQSNPEFIDIYTDGSGLYPGTDYASAGAGVYIPSRDVRISRKVPGNPQTNNRAELFAVILALKWIHQHCDSDERYAIYTDSTYVQNGLVYDVKTHLELWDELKMLIRPGIVFRKVKGHSGNPFNDEADRLANCAAKKPQ